MKYKHLVPLIFVGFIFSSYFFSSSKVNPLHINSLVEKRNLNINVHTIGELEAAKSTVISSRLGNDNAKVIHLINDGTSVAKGDLLVKIDSTTIEEKLEELKAKIKEQEGHIVTLDKSLESEMNQKVVDKNIAESELLLAELEYEKTIHHEGPMEEKRLKSLMEKAQERCAAYDSYYNDLQELAQSGFDNEFEASQILKKIEEEKEAYELAKEQYVLHVNTSFPILKHKAEAQLQRAQIKCKEVDDMSDYKIFKSRVVLLQANNYLEDLKNSMKNAQRELAHTELSAPSAGMVVLREDFRSGQRRKPRIGDTLVKNQPILDLPNLSSMIVKTRVREIDLHKVQIGKTALVEVDAFPQLAFTGKVTYIGVLALKDSQRTGEEKYFDVHVSLNNVNQRLRPGMTSRVTIHSQDIADALTIPYQALYETDHQSTYCYVLNRGKIQKREIEISTMNEQWVVVESGLKEGERVCLTLPPQEIRKM